MSPSMDGGASGPTTNGDAGTAAPAVKPLYLTASWVQMPDQEATTYVSLIDSIDVQGELDFAKAIEIPGYGDAWAYGEWVFVAEGSGAKLSRYSIKDGKLVLDTSISFQNYGAASAAFYDNEILSPTKAYLAYAKGREYIVWNPTTMEILKTIPWPTTSFPTGFNPFHSYMDRGGVVSGKYFFHGIYAHEGEDFRAFGDSSVIGVYDIETDQLVKTIDVPCPMMDTASLADDGYIYLSGWSYMPLSTLAGYTKKNCGARIDAKTQTLDPGWTLDYPTVTGGKQGSALRAVSGNEGIFAVFHGTGVAVTPMIDIWDLDEGADDWELYSIDLTTRAAKPTGVRMSDGSYYESHIGERYFVYLGQDDGKTQVYERTNAGYVAKFKTQGWMSRLFKVR